MYSAVEGSSIRLRQMTKTQVMLVGGALLSAGVLNATGQSLGIAARAAAPSSLPISFDALQTLYMIGWVTGLAVCMPIIRSAGLGRYVETSSAIFAFGSLCGFAFPIAEVLAAVSLVQGLAVGGLGPVAFVAIFGSMRGGRLLAGLAWLAWVAALASTSAALIAIVLTRSWAELLLAQAIIGVAVLGVARMCFPPAPFNFHALRADWPLIAALAVALSTSVTLVGPLSFSSQRALEAVISIAIVSWSATCGLVARGSSALDSALLRKRFFIVPIALNIHVRTIMSALFAASTCLIVAADPTHNVILPEILMSILIGQCLGFPLANILGRNLDCRSVMAIGIVSTISSALWLYLSVATSSLAALLAPLALQATGQVIFIVANLQAGASRLTPPEGPTATIVFNASSLMGALMGLAVATSLLDQLKSGDIAALQQSDALWLLGILLGTGIMLLPLVKEPPATQLAPAHAPPPH